MVREIAASADVLPVGASARSVPSAIAHPIAEPPPDTTAAPETTAPPVPEPQPEPQVPRVYLTFDDGPGKYTMDILDTLAEYDVPATFFVVGMFAEYYPNRLRAVHEAGHAIGCHSYNHEYRQVYASADTITADIARWEGAIEAAIGEVPDTRLYRFPGGTNCSAIEEIAPLYEAVTAAGYRCFDWTCANNDLWPVGNTEGLEPADYLKRSVKQSLAACRGERIMLMHDTSGATAEVLPWIIEYIRGEGYEFATLADFAGEYTFTYGVTEN